MTDVSERPSAEWTPRSTGALLAGLAGLVALMLLAATGRAAWGPSLTAGTVVVAVAGALAWISRREPPPEPPRIVIAPPPPPGPPYALMLDSLPDPVVLAAADEVEGTPGPRILFANAAARELLRTPREGAHLPAAIRNPGVLEAMDEALLGRIKAEAIYEEGGARGRVWRAMARPLATNEGQLALLWMRDETDARRSERMRADFLANASHELRTPLASLTGFVETLRGHARDDEQARERFLGIMANQADRMARLIDDLLSLSRIELSEHIAPSGEVDLGMAVTDVVDALGPLAKEKGVTLDVRHDGGGRVKVTGDRDQIIQVVQNLVANAIKYAGAGGTVTVETVVDATAEEAAAPRNPAAARLSLLSPDHAHAGRYAVLRVSDTGPGIARQYLPRLSERFYRVEGQKSGDRSGTGLGLAIVKHIVNRHRGGITVESIEGEGAAFIAYLPMAGPSTKASA